MKRRKNNWLEEKLRESFAVISYKYVKYICHCGLGDLIIRNVLHKLVKIVNFALVFLINLKYIVFAEAFPLPKFSCRVLFWLDCVPAILWKRTVIVMQTWLKWKTHKKFVSKGKLYSTVRYQLLEKHGGLFKSLRILMRHISSRKRWYINGSEIRRPYKRMHNSIVNINKIKPL